MVVKKAHFAQTLMKKYGWSEGAGLGKREQGRQAPVKVLMKMDKTGLGAKPGEEMANPWWAKAFNKHCKKIRRRNADSEDSDVSSDSDSSDSDNETEGVQEYDNVGRKINSTRAVSMRIKNARKQFYNNFISSGNLKGDPSIIRNADGRKRRIALRLKQLKQYSRAHKVNYKTERIRKIMKFTGGGNKRGLCDTLIVTCVYACSIKKIN